MSEALHQLFDEDIFLCTLEILVDFTKRKHSQTPVKRQFSKITTKEIEYLGVADIEAIF